jgi:hypothetical protein
MDGWMDGWMDNGRGAAWKLAQPSLVSRVILVNGLARLEVRGVRFQFSFFRVCLLCGSLIDYVLGRRNENLVDRDSMHWRIKTENLSRDNSNRRKIACSTRGAYDSCVLMTKEYGRSTGTIHSLGYWTVY